VSIALAAALAVVFGLEQMWGGVSVPVLARMGSLIAERVHAGEYYRLASCTFLHGSVAHFLLNTLVLFLVGRSLERLFGGGRLLFLYLVSGLAGSAGSLWLTQGHSVGASGAIFGLLGAELSLVFRPGGVLPLEVARRARPQALLNLGIMVIGSLQPRIDAAAHLGGGVVGVALALSGVLGRGLPSFERRRAGAVPAAPRWMRALNLLMACGYASALGMALVRHEPWTLSEPPVLMRRALSDAGVSVALPTRLGVPVRTARPQGADYALGDLTLDPAVLALSRFDRAGSADVASDLRDVRDAFAKPPVPELEVASAPRIESRDGRDVVVATYTHASGFVLERAAVVTSDAIWKIEADVWQDFPAWRSLAADVAVSLRPLGSR
jgi:membrane associated rhomboid family serine protease